MVSNQNQVTGDGLASEVKLSQASHETSICLFVVIWFGLSGHVENECGGKWMQQNLFSFFVYVDVERVKSVGEIEEIIEL